MNIPVVAVVGPSNSGKTRVAVALVEVLSARGYRIAAVKHCPHGHQVDRPASDSARLFSAGAAQVILSSPGQKSSIERTDTDKALEDIVASVDSSYHLVVAEGFKGSSAPKVLVLVEGAVSLPGGVIGAVGCHNTIEGVPFYTFEGIEKLADEIQRRFLGDIPKTPDIYLEVDGVPVPLSLFPQKALAGIVQGFLQSLKDVPPSPRKVRLVMDNAASSNGHSALKMGVRYTHLKE